MEKSNISFDKNHPREIPVRKNPGDHQPEQAPKKNIPGTSPGKDNPRNPKEDIV